MPDTFPRASKFLRLDDDDETKIPLDEAIERAKSCPVWPEWCKSALKIAEACGLSRLTEEQAGIWLLSVGSLTELWHDKWETISKVSVLKPPNYMNEIREELQRQEPRRDEILEHIKRTRHADAERAKAAASAASQVSDEKTATPVPLDFKRLATIDGILEDCGDRWAKIPPEPIGAREMGKEVAPRVRGYDVRPNYVQKIAEAKILKPLRRKSGGNYKPSETESVEAKRLLAELKSLPAARKLELIK